MDLSTAMSYKYKDYHDTASRDHDLSRSVMNRMFDVGPMAVPKPYSSSIPDSMSEQTPYCLVDPSYQISPTYTAKTRPSKEYLLMKQAQERESLMENPNVNQLEIQSLQQQQQKELSQWSQMPPMRSTTISSSDGSPLMTSQPTPFSPQVASDQMQAQHASKYQRLKSMSPEVLNQIYGRPSDQSILVGSSTGSGTHDVYEQTACGQMMWGQPPPRVRQLQQEMETRQKGIMTNRNATGIQSYSTGFGSTEPAGTQLAEAYQMYGEMGKSPIPRR